MTPDELRQVFFEIRDIPYSIPLHFAEEDHCCTGKNRKMLATLLQHNYDARWRVCSFKWSDFSLPSFVTSEPHDDNSTHAYLEVRLNNEWKVVDATWDSGVVDKFLINTWDGRSSTNIAVPYVKIYSPEESASIMADETRETFEEDIRTNGKFYEALNDWLAMLRKRP